MQISQEGVTNLVEFSLMSVVIICFEESFDCIRATTIIIGSRVVLLIISRLEVSKVLPIATIVKEESMDCFILIVPYLDSFQLAYHLTHSFRRCWLLSCLAISKNDSLFMMENQKDSSAMLEKHCYLRQQLNNFPMNILFYVLKLMRRSHLHLEILDSIHFKRKLSCIGFHIQIHCI